VIRTLLVVAVLTLSFTQARSQAGGFTEGDLWLYTPAATGISSSDGGWKHIDPLSGSVSQLMGFDHTQQAVGAGCFDPYRKRLVFYANIDGVQFGDKKLWAVDAAGNTHEMVNLAGVIHDMAPTGDGRIYLHRGSELIQWLDQANRLRDLLDDTGTVPFTLPGVSGYPFRGMVYDPGENALLIAAGGGASANCAQTDRICVRKLPLSADGTRVVGPVTSAQFDVDTSSSSENPVGWSRGPAGAYLLVVDTNSNATQSRMLLVDPVAPSISAFATNSNTFAAATNGGTWSSVLGKAVILDTGNDVLRSFSLGESSSGTVLTVAGEVSPNGSSGETVSLIEIDRSTTTCDGAFVPFGDGLVGTGGLTPALRAEGCAAPGEVTTAHIENAVGGAMGWLVFGITEAAMPYRGGVLYLWPADIAWPVALGGSAGVAGEGSADVVAPWPNDPAITGTVLIMQAGFMDVAAAQGWALTQAVLVEVG
jgi:hypothetical protein